MSEMYIPPYLKDPKTVPPLHMTSDPGSFAYNTLKVRIPRLLEETTARGRFALETRARLQALYREITEGTIRPLDDGAIDNAFWNEASASMFGRSWLDVPWYWAESYFYRRVLEATRYFQPGDSRGADPYWPTKELEFRPEAAPRAVEGILTSLPSGQRERLHTLSYAALWGNRADLSYRVAAHESANGQLEAERENLLVDDTAAMIDWLQAQRREKLVLIADNTGTELVLDLAFLDTVLEAGLVERVELHLKPQPFFISDAMPSDLDAAIAALEAGETEGRRLAERIEGYRSGGRFSVRTHWHYTSCLFHYQMPADLASELAATDLVILKGDANYRRLVGDAHWNPTASFLDATAYFPAPFVAFRTLKAELVLGLREGEAERLAAQDRDWLVNGKRGVIQGRLTRGINKTSP